MSASILVVAAHPDDEVLGCGGTIAKHAQQGDALHLICLTNGVGARSSSDRDALELRALARDQAASTLGFKQVVQLDFPDNQMDTVPLLSIAKAIEQVSMTVKPEVVYTHHAGDLNVDHQLCSRAVLTAFRPQPGLSVQAIYGFEVLSSTGWKYGDGPDFVPNHFVDISGTIHRKLQALEAYNHEMRPPPNARSVRAVEALACLRGATVGLSAAEAFVVLRQIG